MKNVDRMIAKAKSLLYVLVDSLSGNDDGFLDALGVVPEDYAQERPDGSIGYDFLKALCDTAAKDWLGYEEEEAACMPEAEPGKKRRRRRAQQERDFTQEAWWDAVTQAEREEVVKYLSEHPEECGSTEQEENKTVKSRDLFGWG